MLFHNMFEEMLLLMLETRISVQVAGRSHGCLLAHGLALRLLSSFGQAPKPKPQSRQVSKEKLLNPEPETESTTRSPTRKEEP